MSYRPAPRSMVERLREEMAEQRAHLHEQNREQARTRTMSRLVINARERGLDVNAAWYYAGLQMRKMEADGVWGDRDRAFTDTAPPEYRGQPIQPFRVTQKSCGPDAPGGEGRAVQPFGPRPLDLTRDLAACLLMGYGRVGDYLLAWGFNNAYRFGCAMHKDWFHAAQGRISPNKPSSQLAQDGYDAYSNARQSLPAGANWVRFGDPNEALEKDALILRNLDLSTGQNLFIDRPIVQRTATHIYR